MRLAVHRASTKPYVQLSSEAATAFAKTLHRQNLVRLRKVLVACSDSVVYEAEACCGLRVCVKIVATPNGRLPVEVVVLQRLQAPCFPKLWRVFRKGTLWAVATHWIDHTGSKVPREQLPAYGRQLLQALQTLHSAGFMSRDVKPANVLWHSGTQSLTLIDFDLATYCGRDHYSAVGTPGFMAPEVRRHQPYRQNADLFSAGATLLAVARGSPVPPDLALVYHTLLCHYTKIDIESVLNLPFFALPRAEGL